MKIHSILYSFLTIVILGSGAANASASAAAAAAAGIDVTYELDSETGVANFLRDMGNVTNDKGETFDLSVEDPKQVTADLPAMYQNGIPDFITSPYIPSRIAKHDDKDVKAVGQNFAEHFRAGKSLADLDVDAFLDGKNRQHLETVINIIIEDHTGGPGTVKEIFGAMVAALFVMRQELIQFRNAL